MLMDGIPVAKISTKIVETEEIDELVAGIAKEQATSLYKNHKRIYTHCQVTALILNTALLLYSHLGLSAVIKSSICPSTLENCDGGVITDPLAVDQCVNNTNDLNLFHPGTLIYDTFGDILTDVGTECVFSPPSGIPEGQGCVQFIINRDFGLTLECCLCFQEQVDCSTDNCLIECIGGRTPPCEACSELHCQPRFEDCAGIDISPFPTVSPTSSPVNILRRLQSDDLIDSDGCIDKNQVNLFDVFDLTFPNSIQKALTGGSEFLAILIIIASGIWPYTKNIIMFIVWFKQMTNERRDRILRIMSILGKWSFLDVFAVVLIMNGVQLNKVFDESSGQVLVVFAESRLAIYAFGIAAIWALVQGESIRYLERAKKLSSNIISERKLLSEKKEEVPINTAKVFKLRMWLMYCSLAGLGFALGGALTIALSFDMTGLITTFDGPNSYEFTTLEVGLNLISECTLYDKHGSVPGAYFLAIIFLAMCIFIPLVTFMLLFIMGCIFTPAFISKKRRNHLVGTTIALQNFAAMDVYVLSLVSIAAQFKGLIKSAIGDGVDEECGVDPDSGEFCIRLTGTLGLGTWLLLVSSVHFWVAQILFAKLLRMLETKRMIY